MVMLEFGADNLYQTKDLYSPIKDTVMKSCLNAILCIKCEMNPFALGIAMKYAKGNIC